MAAFGHRAQNSGERPTEKFYRTCAVPPKLRILYCCATNPAPAPARHMLCTGGPTTGPPHASLGKLVVAGTTTRQPI